MNGNLLPKDQLIRRKGLVIMPAEPGKLESAATFRHASLQAAHLALHHLGCNKDARVDSQQSKYDHVSQTIQKENGVFSYSIDSREVRVNRVLLLGSNYLIWEPAPSTSYARQGVRILDSPLRDNNYIESQKDPENSDLMAFSSTLFAKEILEKNGIPSTILYMPSDLPPGEVANLRQIRDDMKENKIIHPFMDRLIAEHGYKRLPVYSNNDLRDNARLACEISEGNAIWYSLESEFRNQARQLVEDLVMLGIEGTVERYFLGGKQGNLDEWRACNAEKKDTWDLVLRDGTYYVISTRYDKQTLPIPIGRQTTRKDGSKTAGAPMCALITAALLKKSREEFGFDHLISAFHSSEIPIASAGFFLARRLLGVDIHAYALQINRKYVRAESCGLDGKHAFIDRLSEPEMWEPGTNGQTPALS